MISCTHKASSLARPVAHARNVHCSAAQQSFHSATCNSRRAALLAIGTGLLTAVVPVATAEENKKDQSKSSAPAPAQQPLSLTITAVSPSVSAKMRDRDEYMAWKCNGVSMYDCDGERAAEMEKNMEELRSTFIKK
mmetsp:Transcript_21058/g.46193  ORF Transcript_21058/g.46193 Transcript_21058/m.46193 type:complete len:136 (-) Transcript_21058:949-1356(-)|eukprot:CAMPEP_0202892212 /NCGR_PEP_ID=MMETSP1392-20130828/1988_1 /ASSEMBLY_ACC=CAM_ASM_000868 /TAXON_ID=225041 /ORGANISM="Chlamydomonas chlamydogama, Strain SAG 11-48b" /LENGTH=135 /DNA_ID=CAMNT_0049576101 /DNA_START=29 /DNA_END=436 /DNA_ORIENTATION=+